MKLRYCEICGKLIPIVEGERPSRYLGRKTCRAADDPVAPFASHSKCARALMAKEVKLAQERKASAKPGQKSGITKHSKRKIQYDTKRHRAVVKGVYEDIPKPQKPKPVDPAKVAKLEEERLRIHRQACDQMTDRVNTPLKQTYGYDPMFSWLFN